MVVVGMRRRRQTMRGATHVESCGDPCVEVYHPTMHESLMSIS